jgi:cyclin-dependent kinase 8/11
MDKAGTSSHNILRLKAAARPAWWDLYEVVGKIGEGTYGLVYLVRVKDTTQGNKLAIKKFKPSKDGDGVSPTAIR